MTSYRTSEGEQRYRLTTGRKILLAALMLVAGLCLRPAWAANPSGDLRVEVITAYNLVVDSNIESPSGYCPRSAYMGATFYNDGTNDLTNVVAYIGDYIDGTNDTPGLYPTNQHPAYPTIVGPLTNGTFALTHEGGASGAADATRYIGTIPAGGHVTVYWLVSYPVKDINGKAVWGPSVKPDDDLQLRYDIWGKALDAGVDLTATETRTVTMRNEISAMANKIMPNTANKVPQEYLDLLAIYSPAWTNLSSDGSVGTRILTQGFWYDLGNIGQGFDNDGDLVPDQNAWMQPVGDPAQFDASCFRLVKTHALVVVKLKTGGEQVYNVDDQLYFQNVPENNGAIGLVVYEFLVMRPSGVGTLTPYQEVASGFDNEKFNGDYGTPGGSSLVGGTSTVVMAKSVDLATTLPGTNLQYTVAFTNTGTLPVGDPTLGVPLVVQDSIPTGTYYVAASATNGNVPPAGATYTVLFSTNRGTSWLQSEPAASNVTDIQWWLSSALATGASGIVRFSVNIPASFSNASPIIPNVAGLSFGSSAPFLTNTATTWVLGTNQLGDRVFADTGAGAAFGNGIQDGGELGLSNVTVQLYLDGNTNGLVDSGDILLSTTNTSTNGSYLFSSLADGKFLSVVDATNSWIPFGYVPSTSTWYSVDLDSAHATSTMVSYTNADFGFAPALTMNKSLLTGSPTREGSNVTFAITVTNRMPGGGGLVTYTVWATTNVAGLKTGTGWNATETNAYLPAYPDNVYAIYAANGNDDAFGLGGYSMAPQNGSIKKVEMMLVISVTNGWVNDTVQFSLHTNDNSAVSVFLTNMSMSTLPVGTNTLVYDVTTSLTTWAWSSFGPGSSNGIRTLGHKTGAADGSWFAVDQAGFRITSDQSQSLTNSPATLSPVPLTDTYNVSNLQYVSASRTPSSVTTNGTAGAIYWSDIGPIYPGGTSSVSVTFKALEPLGGAQSNVVTNTASVTNATYSSGRPANTATSGAPLTILWGGTIGDYVWWDLDRDGTQDVNEAGIQGVSVVLTSTNTATRTNVTDQNGYYLFEGLPSNGLYRVSVLTNTILGGTVTNTWDGEGAANHTNNVSLNLATNDEYLLADFGYKYASSSNIIEGTIWNDVNRNGATSRDTGENWLTNVTVYLFTNAPGPVNTAIATNRADTNGYFRFTGNYAGTYSVWVSTNTGMMTNAPWVESFDTDGIGGTSNYVSTNVVAGTLTHVDFSYYRTGSFSIGDTVYYDWNGNTVQDANEEGMGNIRVYLYEDENTNGAVDTGVDAIIYTATNGFYLFPNLASNNYQVIVDQTFSNFPSLFNCTADPYGANDGRSEVFLATASNTNQDFGYQPFGSGSIGDTVWRDANGDGVQAGTLETGIGSAPLTLWTDFNNDGTYVSNRTTTTGSGGTYLFSSLPDGKYRVTVSTTSTNLPTDAFGFPYQPTTTNSYDVTISNGNTVLTADFGFAPLAAIGDTIFWDANTNGLQDWTESGATGVTVNLYRDLNGDGLWDAGDTQLTSRVTDTNGLYLFSGLATGRYVVVVVTNTGPLSNSVCSSDPDGDGVAFSNCNSQIGVRLNYGTSFMGADFGYVPAGVIGDTVWMDLDADGVRDATEPGIPYVWVGLYSNATLVASNQTDADGYYFFSSIQDGTNTVRVLTNDVNFPAGLSPVYDPDGILNDAATNVYISGGSITKVNGTNWTAGDLAIDFGYRYAGNNSLSGTIGLEGTPYDGRMGVSTSGVGVGEVAYPNVVVYVYRWNDTNNDTVIQSGERTLLSSTTTATNGDYSFTGLPNGSNYIVSIAAPEEGLFFTTTNGATPAWRIVNTTNAENYTVSAYQVVTVALVITNMDFAFRTLKAYDYGDLPQWYSILQSDTPSGARHRVTTTNLYLGITVNTEIDGQPSVNADADAYDDGVTNLGVWQVGGTGGTVRVNVGAGSGWLVGYIDFNGNSNMMDTGEMIISTNVSGPGVYTNSFTVSTGAISATNETSLYARFRLFDSQPAFPALAFSGSADNGEVEDYRWRLGAIGDRVWNDVNSNDVYDAGEPGLSGVRVFVDLNGDGLYQANEPSVLTDASGIYDIGGFSPGTYTVAVDTNTLPTTAVPGYDLDGTNTPNRCSNVVMTNGQVRTDVDFGYRGLSTDLAITKTVNDSFPGTNEVIWYTITLTNNGPVQATSCVVTDQWPAQVTFSNAAASQGSYDSTSRLWAVGTLNVGGYATLVITGRVNAVTNLISITNTVWISGMDQFDTNPSNNTSHVEIVTLVVVTRFEAHMAGGDVVVEWETASEVGTAGFYLYRQDRNGDFVRVSPDFLPSVPDAPQGGVYTLVDAGAAPGNTYTYRLVEVETSGVNRDYGPFVVSVPKAAKGVAGHQRSVNRFEGKARVSTTREARMIRKAAFEAEEAARAAGEGRKQ